MIENSEYVAFLTSMESFKLNNYKHLLSLVTFVVTCVSRNSCRCIELTLQRVIVVQVKLSLCLTKSTAWKHIICLT